MKQITPLFLAGYFDCDGSFQLQIGSRLSSSGKVNIRVNPRATIAFMDGEKQRDVLYAIQSTLQSGAIYFSNKGTEKAKISWMTTNVEDCLKVAEYVLPYLWQKERQARGFIKVCEIIRAGKLRRRGINLYGGEKIYSKEQLIEMITIATTLNAGIQNIKYRESQSRNTQYYLDMIEKIYTT